MAASRIRWDRLGRWALIAVFAFVLYLYIGPAVSWVSTYRQVGLSPVLYALMGLIIIATIVIVIGYLLLSRKASRP